MRVLKFVFILAFIVFSCITATIVTQKIYAVTNSCASTGCCNNTNHDQYDSKTGLKVSGVSVTCSGSTCSAKVSVPTSSSAYNAIVWAGPGACTSAGYCYRRPFHGNTFDITGLQAGKTYQVKVSTSTSGGSVSSGYGVEYPGGSCTYRLVASAGGITPTPSTSPSPSPSAKSTDFKIILGFPGIGFDGRSPQHTTRPIKVELYAPTVQNPGGPGTSPLKTATGTVTYDSGSDNNAGYFVSNTPISFPNLATGQYQILVKAPRYLYKLAVNAANTNNSHVFNITADTTTSLDPMILSSGDVAVTSGQINHLNITDYNIILSCYGDKAKSSSCPVGSSGPDNTNLADLNDDGVIDIVDLNIWLRSLSSLQASNAIGCDQGDCQGD